jgi:hypothetical protein
VTITVPTQLQNKAITFAHSIWSRQGFKLFKKYLKIKIIFKNILFFLYISKNKKKQFLYYLKKIN